MQTEIKPVYCRDCKGRDTWERDPGNDIKGESGKVLFHRWKCSKCGNTTIYPSPDL